MSRWFRFYADAMRSPKVAALSDSEFRLWVELLAIASENDGHIPPLESLKHVLKRRLDHLSRGLKGLIRALLIDALTDGYEPHNWAKFQYKSDTSTERVHKFREKRNVSETAPDTEQNRVVIAKAIPTERQRAVRGTRIALDWQPGLLPPNVAELVSQWPENRMARELDNFRDYWKARSRDATKLDWDATWHNRIRDIHDRVIKDGSHGKQDTRNGVARAIDSRLGFGEPARTVERRPDGVTAPDHVRTLALPAPGQ